MKRTPLQRRKQLDSRGRRGKRLAKGDNEISREFRSKPCYCGCNEEPDPAHLESRRYESTRHDERYIIPLCRSIHDWLDHTAAGVVARARLFEMATERELTPADVVSLLVEGGAYEFKRRRG